MSSLRTKAQRKKEMCTDHQDVEGKFLQVKYTRNRQRGDDEQAWYVAADGKHHDRIVITDTGIG